VSQSPDRLIVMVATRPGDFRKGAVGLAALVKNELGLKPISGVAYSSVRTLS
jgi:transposase